MSNKLEPCGVQANHTNKMESLQKKVKSVEKENRETTIRDMVVEIESISKDEFPEAHGIFESNRLISECESKLFPEGHANYPSLFKFKETVDLDFFDSGKIKNCKIKAIRFTEGKVKYDVEVLIFNEGKRNKDLKEMWTCIKNVDSVCVVKPEEGTNIFSNGQILQMEQLKKLLDKESLETLTDQEIIDKDVLIDDVKHFFNF